MRDSYENYPLWIVIVTAVFSLSSYIAGSLLLSRLGSLWLVVYLLYIFFLELRLLRGSCVNCYYFGKTCALCKGRLSCLLFRKGDTKKFAHTKITWKDIIPDFLVTLVPVIAGIVILIRSFSWLVLGLVVWLFLATFVGNAVIRGQLACKYCKQRKIGCPAEKLFNKSKK